MQLKLAKAAATRKCNYKRVSPFVEVVVPRTASYSDVLALGATALSITEESDGTGGPLTLFRCDGTVVPSDPLTQRGSEGASTQIQQWSLKNYLGLIRKSAAQVKFCIGYLALVRHITIPFSACVWLIQ